MHRSKGFTLLSVMIALAVGLIVVGMTMTSIAAAMKARHKLEETTLWAVRCYDKLKTEGAAPDECRHAPY